MTIIQIGIRSIHKKANTENKRRTTENKYSIRPIIENSYTFSSSVRRRQVLILEEIQRQTTKIAHNVFQAVARDFRVGLILVLLLAPLKQFLKV